MHSSLFFRCTADVQTWKCHALLCCGPQRCISQVDGQAVMALDDPLKCGLDTGTALCFLVVLDPVGSAISLIDF